MRRGQSSGPRLDGKRQVDASNEPRTEFDDAHILAIQRPHKNLLIQYGFRSLLGTIAANFLLSLRWSVVFSYQPQGRYLFPSLLPAALLLIGTFAYEDKLRRVRLASAGLALTLSAWSLLFLALPRLGLH